MVNEPVDEWPYGWLALAYMDAKELVIAAGFAEEIDWQASVQFENITEQDFLREGAWVMMLPRIRTRG